MRYQRHEFGFTLAELLIALAILGVIATFTIPKILDSGVDGKYNAMAKEVAGTITGAYQNYKLQNAVSASTGQTNLTPYINYVKIDTISVIDGANTQSSVSCGSANTECLVMHNGGIVWYETNETFGGTNTVNGIWFLFDPDGTYGGSTTGASKGVFFCLYYNGKMRTWGSIEPATVSSINGPDNPDTTYDPSWFSWSN